MKLTTLLANGHITLNIPVLVRSLKLFQAMLSPVSTWMGDRLGTLGAVGIFFVFDATTILQDMKEELDGRHQLRIIQ